MSDQTKHIWRSQRVFPQEQRYRNTLFPREGRRYVGGGIRWWLVATVVMLFGGVGTAIWSPILTISSVAVNGTSSVDANKVRKAADEYLNGRALGIFPRRSSLIAPTNGLASFVRKALRGEPSVTAVDAQKTFPYLVTVTVTEQIPNVVYINNGIHYLMSRDGAVTGKINDGEKVPKKYPQLYDQTSRTVAVGPPIVKKATIDALFIANERITELTGVAVSFYFLPPAQCPKPEELIEEGDSANANVNVAPINANTGSNVNGSKTNTNANSNKPLANTNSNNSAKKGNANANINASPAIPVCDLNDIVLKSIELHARTSEKWDILMRVDQSVADQMVRLGRVMNETKPDRAKLRSIDLRFKDHVVIR